MPKYNSNSLSAFQSIASIDTPFLAIDKKKLTDNISRLNAHIASLNGQLRPHLKTIKSIPGAQYLVKNRQHPITVSTLLEAEEFARHGFTNILYAVGITPSKLKRVEKIKKMGVELTIIIDSLFQAKTVATHCNENDVSIAVLIEIDCDGHRGGIKPDSPELITIGEIINNSKAELKGIMTHAGESYYCTSTSELAKAAEQERLVATLAANKLTSALLPCPIVSIGSTPTAFFTEDLTGITEVRAGVYCFFDLVMSDLGLCSFSDIALSVITTVIGQQEDKGWLIIDAGWMALSADTGNYGHGIVCDTSGKVIQGLIVNSANQEHGIIKLEKKHKKILDQFPIGTRLRILPNHACATAAQHKQYMVFNDNGIVADIWPRICGW